MDTRVEPQWGDRLPKVQERLADAGAGYCHRRPATGQPNDTTAYRDSGIAAKLAERTVMADSSYRGNREVIIPSRKSAEADLPTWWENLNATHRRTRARIEHALAGMKTWKILRDYRRAAHTLGDPRLWNRPSAQPRPARLTPTPHHTK